MRIAEDLGNEMFVPYIETVMEEHKKQPNYFLKEEQDNSALWDRVNKLWNRNMEFVEILHEIESIKDG